MDKNEELEVEESLDLPEIAEDQEDTTDWKAEAQKLRDKAIAQRERTKTLKQKLADKEKAIENLAGVKKEEPTKTGELDETQLDYLDLKGITDQDEIDIIQNVMKRTGQTVRQALKDEYVSSKLDALRKEKEVKEATPSASRRSGSGGTDSLEVALAKFEATGKLPEDFTLRTKVVNALTDRDASNKPAWHK